MPLLTTTLAIPDVAPVADLDDFVHGSGLRAMVLATAMQGAPQVPLFEEALLPPDIVREHYRWPFPPDVRIYALPGHVVGGGGLLERDGCVWLPRDCFPSYLAAFGGGQTIPDSWAGSLTRDDRRCIDIAEPAACPMHPNLTYGHFLLEMLPRFHLLRLLRDMGVEFKVVLERSIADWARMLAAFYFPLEDVVWYDGAEEVVRAPVFYVAGMMHTDHNLHPLFNQVAEDLKRRVAASMPRLPLQADAPPLLYFSRRDAWPIWHRMENEAEIEDAMRGLGFRVIQPQQLPYAEQLRLFERAECMVSEYSSALHNALFARRGIKVVALNRINWYQGMITRLRGQHLAYVTPADGAMRDWRSLGNGMVTYRVDPAAARDTVARFLAS